MAIPTEFSPMTSPVSQTAPIALVTGGSRGLGRATALALAQRGVDVILTYQSRAEEAHSVCHEIEASAAQPPPCGSMWRTAGALRLLPTRFGQVSPPASVGNTSMRW